MTRPLLPGIAIVAALLPSGCGGAPHAQRPPEPYELPSVPPRTDMGVVDDDARAGTAHESPADVPAPRVECPSGSKKSGSVCVATKMECPWGSKLDQTVDGPICVGQVNCPLGTEWTGTGCEPPTTQGAAAPASSIPQCQLHINSVPTSDVYIDGKKVGVTPIMKLRAPEGRLTVTFVHAELGRINMNVACEGGKTKPVHVKFKR